MVMHGDEEDSFRAILADDILIEVMFDFWPASSASRNFLLRSSQSSSIAEVYAFVADVDGLVG